MIDAVTTNVMGTVVDVINPVGSHDVVLVCEHASPFIPANFNNLGLDPEAARSHIAWDPGALDTAKAMSQSLDAVLVAGCVSRLVYDCNRPPEAASAIPAVSEVYEIPGNQCLSDEARRARTEIFYRPFEKAVRQALSERKSAPVLVTVHSFTPIFHGEKRDVEIGILHDDDARLADALLNVACGYEVRRNEPYGPADGVTHTLKRQGMRRDLLNVMIEVRSDLISTPENCQAMGETLTRWIGQALETVQSPRHGGRAS